MSNKLQGATILSQKIEGDLVLLQDKEMGPADAWNCYVSDGVEHTKHNGQASKSLQEITTRVKTSRYWVQLCSTPVE